MRNPRLVAVVLAMSAGLLSGCSGGPSASGSSPSAPSPGTETPATATAPATSRPSNGPGQGNAELAITVVPSGGSPELNFTLLCTSGTPAAKSSHPDPAAACAALKANPAIVAPAAPGSDRACTQQYGGPQKATVTGSVDGVAVDSSFARTNGCEISAWDAAKNVLGAAGGAS